jgi:hypothetical protein
MTPKRLRWVMAVVIVAATALSCGEGNVIFNVDVYSFLKGVGQDSVPYVAPSPFDTISPQAVNLLPTGLGSSVVESVTVAGTVDYNNSMGSGTVGLELYIDTVPDVYAGTPAFAVAPVAVTAGDTVRAPFQGDVNSLFHQLFLAQKVYVGMRVVATGAAAGVARLSALGLRIVIQDKIFK